MKIKRSELNRLIENFLKEAGTGDMKGSSDPSRFNKDPDADDFELTDDMLDPDQSAHEDYVRAVDAYRNPSKPIGNMPNFSFGDKHGVNTRTKGTHIPSAHELGHVRRYQSGEIGGVMPSVDNQEVTVSNFGENEVTEESPFGTQYSLEDTAHQYRYDDKTPVDPGHTAHSGDDFYLDSEDDDTSEEEEDIGYFEKIRRYILGKK